MSSILLPLLMIFPLMIALVVVGALTWAGANRLKQTHQGDFSRYAAFASRQHLTRWAGIGVAALTLVALPLSARYLEDPAWVLAAFPVAGLAFGLILLTGEQRVARDLRGIREADLTPRQLTRYASRLLLTLSAGLVPPAVGLLAYATVNDRAFHGGRLPYALSAVLLLAQAGLTSVILRRAQHRPIVGSPALPSQLDDRLRQATLRPALASLSATGLLLALAVASAKTQTMDARLMFLLLPVTVIWMYLICVICFPTPLTPPEAATPPAATTPGSPAAPGASPSIRGEWEESR